MRIPQETIERIKAETDILDVVSEYIDLKKRGANYFGSCPFHTDKTPSFSVSPERNIFKCFSCGAGGDAIGFLMQHNHLSYPEAIRYLAEKKGIAITEDPKETERIEKQKTIFDLNQEAMRFYYKNLLMSKKPKEYLDTRSIDHDTMNRFYLGYAKDSWDDLHNHLQKNGFSIQDAIDVGLLAKSQKGKVYDYYRNRLMFPIFDTRNRVIGFGARTLGDDKAKYLNSKESIAFTKGNRLYGLQNVTRSGKDDPVILVEGYMDVIQMVKYGYTRTVASLGTALTENQAQLLKRHAGQIYILYDADDAGQRATERAIDVLEAAGIRPKIIQLDGEKDPDDFLKARGKEAMDVAIQNAMAPTKYYLRQEMRHYSLDNTEERIAFVDKATAIIAKLDRAFERDEYIKILAKQVAVSEASLTEEVERKRGNTTKIGYKNKQNFAEQTEKPVQKVTDARVQLWLTVIAYAMEGTEAFRQMQNYWNEDFLAHPKLWRVATAMTERYRADAEHITIQQLRETFAHDRTMDALLQQIERAQKSIQQDLRANEHLQRALQHTILKDERKVLLEEIEWLSQSDDVDALLAEKLSRLQDVNKQLTSME